MNKIYLVLGYGIPKDIFRDETYQRYLTLTFNAIYAENVQSKTNSPLILFSGGPTDCFKPYKRTEAEEMIKLFRKFMHRHVVKALTQKWRLVPEKQALSTGENLIYTKQLLKKRSIKSGTVFIICEYTRKRRVSILARETFGSRFRIKVQAIDFDTGPNRYASPSFLEKKEKNELREFRKALRSPTAAAKHHKLMQEKLAFIRNDRSMGHDEAISRWWAQQME